MKKGFTHRGTPWSEISVGISKDDAAAQGNAWLVLRNKTRLCSGNVCVAEIAEALEESPSVISGHLAILRAVKLVQKEKYHSYSYYTLTPGAMDKYKRFLDSL